MVFIFWFLKRNFNCSFPSQDTLGKDIGEGEPVFYAMKIETAGIETSCTQENTHTSRTDWGDHK